MLNAADCSTDRRLSDEALAAHEAAVALALAPATEREVVGLLAGRLFAVLAMPEVSDDGPDVIGIWVDRLRRFPPDVLARAIDAVIDRHKWPRPPTIADVVQACNEDADYGRRRMAKTKARILRTKPAPVARRRPSERERARLARACRVLVENWAQPDAEAKARAALHGEDGA